MPSGHQGIYTSLTDVTLERIANQWPSAEIDDLMPWNYKA